MSDLQLIADAFALMPDIAAVRRVEPEGLITRDGWMLWLKGSWLADHAGTGETIEDAYEDAKNRLAVIRKAA